MGCDRIEVPNGGTVIVCSRGRRGKPCSVPGCREPASALCDYPVNKGGLFESTCDRPMCAAHRTRVGDDVDYCPPHARHHSNPAQGGLCRACSRRLVWAFIVKKGGEVADKPHPFNAEQLDSDPPPNYKLAPGRQSSRWYAKHDLNGEATHVSHFATCPRAKEFRP